MNSFDLKNFLTENKLTSNSRFLDETKVKDVVDFDGQKGLLLGTVNNVKIYSLEGSSVSDEMYYALVDNVRTTHLFSVDVAGEEVNLDYVKQEVGIKISDKLAQFIVNDINNELNQH